MRIGVNTLFLIPGEVGGSETYLVQTLLTMARNHADTPLTLFTNRENDSFFRRILGEFPQVAYHLLPFFARNRPHRILREQLHLPWAVRRSGVDVLWSPGYTAPIRCDVPQAVSILDMQYKSHPEDMSPPARLATDVLVRTAVRRCQKILTISAFSKSEILKYTAADPEHIHVTSLAVDPAFMPRLSMDETRIQLSRIVPSDLPYLLCVANTYPHKNVAALVRACGRIRTRIPHRLILVGKPRRGEPDVEHALAGIPEDRVLRLRGIDRQTLIALYQCADLFIFPSLYEGFGLPVLEAMTAGTPVLTTRMGSIPEIGDDCVEFFDHESDQDLEEKIMNMLGLPPDKRREIIERAVKRSTAFSWSLTANATIKCLEKAYDCAEPRT
ncbi:glycosyltransferase family 4 protein [Desulfonatronum parangueonense]